MVCWAEESEFDERRWNVSLIFQDRCNITKCAKYSPHQQRTDIFNILNGGYDLRGKHLVTENSLCGWEEKKTPSTLFTLNLSFNWVKSSVAFLCQWNLSYSEVALSFSPVCWGWFGPYDSTSLVCVSGCFSWQHTHSHTYPHTLLLLIMLSLCWSEKYGAGRNPNHHCRPPAKTGRCIDTHISIHGTYLHSHVYNRSWIHTRFSM